MPKQDIEWAEDSFKENAELYDGLDDYYEGDHPLLFATEKFRNTFGTLFRAFADNLCPAVVDAVADRLAVESWDGADAAAAEDLWKRARLARVTKQVFLEAPKKGDAYLLVWPDKNDKVRFWPHDAEQVTVQYDDEEEPGLVVMAAKHWTTNDKKTRLNLYYPDHIERYVTIEAQKNGAFPGNLDKWTAFSADVDNPWGKVPVFHFANNAGLGEMGQSELKDVIPVQNALNKSVCDMLVAMEFVAYPQRYATGLQVEVDEDTGKPKNPPFTPGVDRVWTAAGDVKFGEFKTADLKGFLEVQNDLRAEIARVSGTPTHFLNLEKTWPSGETLKVSEGRLIKKITDRQVGYGDVLVDAMRLGLQMEKKSDEADLEPVWANASPHNPLLDAETQLVKQQAGVSQEQSLKELGYSDDEVKAMMKANEVEAQKKIDQQMQAVAPPGGPTAFTRNGSPGQPSKPAPVSQQKTLDQGYMRVPRPRAGMGQTSEG